MPKLDLSPWQRHVLKWRNCERCELASRRNTVVLARGKVPCDVLFVGEAPGDSEDVIGSPFVGPAGQLLDDMIQDAIGGLGLRIAFTNVIGCVPKDETRTKMDAPPAYAIKACAPRLEEFVAIARPKVVFGVGKVAEKHGPKGSIGLVHPAAILRGEAVGRGIVIQRTIVTIRDACRGLT